ncbi:hypothetical protein NDN08_003170 [Rhodosorus marinus]|uniref:Peptidase S8/S53 domain-containing protein n=1 Tax=Rhodosorus marinus TaxID=101924 RepID=A0AAV8UVR4_9RHOD|nr:hypothetical protein NDN08_003170 [Rhodosorus marinus]
MFHFIRICCCFLGLFLALLAACDAAQFEVRLSACRHAEDAHRLFGPHLHAIGGGWFVAHGKSIQNHLERLDWQRVRVFEKSRSRREKVTMELKDVARLDEELFVDIGVVVFEGTMGGVLKSVSPWIEDYFLSDDLSSSKILSIRASKEHVGDIVASLEGNDHVLWVTKEPKRKLLNNFASVSMQSASGGASRLDNTPIWEQNVTGTNNLIGIADTGIDFDSCYFRDQDTVGNTTVDSCNFKHRKIACYYRVRTADAEDGDGHGTHVAGTALGLHYHTSSSGNPNYQNLVRDRSYRNGVAPGSKLVFQDIQGSNGVLYSGQLGRLFKQAYRARARVHSNSWGCSDFDPTTYRSTCVRYDSSAYAVDLFMWENKDFLVIFAAGNEGSISIDNGGDYKDGYFTVGTPATSKNGIAVGAVSTSDSRRRCRISPCSNGDMFKASSKGFMMDGRIKPDLVAPGVEVVSALSSGDADDNRFSSKCSDGGSNKGVGSSSGTSMSAPVIAGAASLVRQYYNDFNPLTGYRNVTAGPLGDLYGPSAALVKATLLCGSGELNGQYYDGSEIRSFEDTSAEKRRQTYGWGMPVLTDVLNFGDRSLFISDRRELIGGEEDVFEFEAGSDAEVKIFLAYSDFPGSVQGRGFATTVSLVNDLDLSVQCVSGGCMDNASTSRVDPVENIVTSVQAGAKFRVKVTAVNLSRKQHYALVVGSPDSNVNVVSNPEVHDAENNFVPNWTRVEGDISGITDTVTGGLDLEDFSWGYAVAIGVGSIFGVLLITGIVFPTYLSVNTRKAKKQLQASQIPT